MKCKITNKQIHGLGEPGDEVDVDEHTYRAFSDNLEPVDDDGEGEDRGANYESETAASVTETIDDTRTDGNGNGEEEAADEEREASVQRSETAASAPETIDEGETDASPNIPDDEEATNVQVSEMSVSELKSFLDDHGDDLSNDDLDRMYEAEEQGQDRSTAKDAIDAQRN